MYPDAVTWWHRQPDEGREARWERTAVPEAHIETSRGSSRSVSGDSGSGTCVVIVPARCAGLCAWAAGDRFAVGVSGASEPPSGAFTATHVEPVRMGGAVHHVEIGGE